MTIGIAITYLDHEKRTFFLAGDSRGSTDDDHTDFVIKTYALGERCGAIGAGHALSFAAAAEMTRGVAEDANRLSPDKPINFYSTVRLFAYWLNKLDGSKGWSRGCEVAIAGFLESGQPCIAKVVTTPERPTEVFFYTHVHPGALVVLVGNTDAKRVLCRCIYRALVSAEDWLSRVCSTIWYLNEHESNTMSKIGGGVAIAVCPTQSRMVWPLVYVEGRAFLRGLEVTGLVSPEPPEDAVVLNYDQTWHSVTDQHGVEPPMRDSVSCASLTTTTDGWIKPEHVFTKWTHDHEALQKLADVSLPKHNLIIVRPGELPD